MIITYIDFASSKHDLVNSIGFKIIRYNDINI